MNNPNSPTYEYLIGASIEQLGQYLPQEIDVLRMFCHYESLPESNRISEILCEIERCYFVVGIPLKNKETIRIKIKRLVVCMKQLLSKRKVKSRREKQRQEDFSKSIRNLFEVICPHASLSVTQALFLEDQRTNRLHQINEYRNDFEQSSAISSDIDIEELNQNSYPEYDIDPSSDFEPDDNPDTDPEYEPSEDESDDNIKEPIPRNLLDETSASNASYRVCEKLLKIGIKIDGGNPKKFAVSKTTLWEQMTKSRAELRSQLLNKLSVENNQVVIQFDGKSYSQLGQRHIGREERLIVVCHDVKKNIALGLFAIPSKRGFECASKVTWAIRQHKLENRIVGIVSDTENTNTGERNGACALMEDILQRLLLHLMCRHHIYERILEAVFQIIFGLTTGPRIDTFDVLKQFWADIKNANYAYHPIEREKLNDSPLLKNFTEDAISILLTHSNQNHFRKDYAELIDLNLKFFGINTGRSFKVPGATSNARWMARAIYALKTYLFRSVLELDQSSIENLERFCLFVALVYTKFWNQCPNAIDAPVNDLKLLKEIDLYQQIDGSISMAAMTAFKRHLWYLGDELIVLSLFSDKISDEERIDMSLVLIPVVSNRTNNSIRHTDGLTEIQGLELTDFFSTRSFFMLQLLKIDTSFLMENPDGWNELISFKRAKKKIHDLIVVVNDASEWGLQLGANLIENQRVQSENRLQDFFVSAYWR